jgi:hypothetical protein
MKQMRTVKLRRPALPPILEIDEDGLPVSEMSFSEGRRWTADGEEPAGVLMGDWPTEFDD